MNTILWILQAALCLKFLSVAYSHGIRPDQEKMERGMKRFGAAARPLLVAISVCVFLCGVALVLPAVGVLPSLAPIAAAVLAGMMLLAAGFHIACRETPNVWVSVVLLALAAFVAYGRWAIAPL